MPTTITTYTTFVAGTKAKAAELNANLSNHRGDLLPINTDTGTASDGTHDLGSDEHRWDVSYVNSVDFETSTNTATVVAQGQTGNTGGALEVLVEGATVAAFGPGNGYLKNYSGSRETYSSGVLTAAAAAYTGTSLQTIAGMVATITTNVANQLIWVGMAENGLVGSGDSMSTTLDPYVYMVGIGVFSLSFTKDGVAYDNEPNNLSDNAGLGNNYVGPNEMSGMFIIPTAGTHDIGLAFKAGGAGGGSSGQFNLQYMKLKVIII